ncbi:OmpA family protein [Vogesella oryzae]|uniref:OmpA family protein n=1 Tax=Vogesella oryzae TaxID=1735285 RepID=UPI0015816E3A|nr:OmpA family protein [Vogesella oryzae]
MKKSIKLSALLASLLVSTAALAAPNQGYSVDGQMTNVIKNAYGECWRLPTTYDKARDGLVECGDREAAKPVVAAVAPAPVAPAAPKYVTKNVSLSAEGLFEFNSAKIVEGNQQLNDLVNSLKSDSMLKSVAITGHTDYLGSAKYNQALSEKRANAVKDYFVAAGISADKVSAVGVGESEAKLTAECTAKKFKKRADLIACLAGDRRFDVTVETAKEEMAK